MPAFRLCVILLLGGILLGSLHGAAPPVDSAKGQDRVESVLRLARRIDARIDAGLEMNKAVPAPLADDSEFIRRVYLDVIGRIPRVSEVREFLADPRSDKRIRLVDRLLASPNHASHFTHVWRDLLLPDTNNQQVQALAYQVEPWLRSRLQANMPYNRLVRELITARLAQTTNPPASTPADRGALAFYQANEMKPENLAASTSRLFLGVKIECAQCHDHPFASWTRKQFWEYAAFFAGVRPVNPNQGVFGLVSDDPRVHEIAMPGTERKVQARFLDGQAPAWTDKLGARQALADWMVSPSNPFFARAAANRLWEHFLGTGLVDPVDDFREENPASHPELVEDLAQALVDSGYDLRFLMRAILATRTYQRSSRRTDPSQEELRVFARMPLRSLTSEQVFDSLATAVGYRGDTGAQRFNLAINTPRGEIQSRFANPVDRRTEFQMSILQALALMNGRFIGDATSLERSETLAAVIDSPFLSSRDKLDTLFLAALARPMRGSEVGRLVPYVEAGGPSRNPARALADVFWVLLNSSEFILNH
ncbi:MAG: DUF1549 and DUF1553 domain-containing protein [Gemmataceae bacterium]